MKQFTDTEARTWAIKVNVDVVKRVQSVLDVNLLHVAEDDLVERLVADPILLCDVLYVVCKPECDARGVSDEDFGRAMAGDAIHDATEAFLEELVDFFPPVKRRLMAAAIAKFDKLQAIASARVMGHLESDELEKKLETELGKILAGGD